MVLKGGLTPHRCVKKTVSRSRMRRKTQSPKSDATAIGRSLFPYHHRPGSHAPYESPVEFRAVYMSDAARAVSGHPPN